jgi:hypothetical protein
MASPVPIEKDLNVQQALRGTMGQWSSDSDVNTPCQGGNRHSVEKNSLDDAVIITQLHLPFRRNCQKKWERTLRNATAFQRI